jgi:hypothetical protein
MHGLDIIIRRNAEAAGREEAHARNDGDIGTADAILTASLTDGAKAVESYERGYSRGRQEG